MEDYTIPIGLIALLLFSGACLILNTLIMGISTGVLYVSDRFGGNQQAFRRNDPRRFHQSDFWSIFFLYCLFAIFIWFLSTGSLFFLTLDGHGRLALILLAFINLAITLRRPSNPQTKPNISFSVVTIYAVIITILFIYFVNGFRDSTWWQTLGIATSFSALAITHMFRLRFSRFILKPRKKAKPRKQTS